MVSNDNIHRIVIVGAGAGGLELAAQLGRKLGRKGLARIVLVDAAMTHIWKPLLHEVAAGTLDSHEDEVNYLAYAYHHGFEFQPGRMIGLDRQQRYIQLEGLSQGDEKIIPDRQLSYDTLIMAVGSVSHDFGVPGVAEHCVMLDSRPQAERFQQLFLKGLMRIQAQPELLLKEPLTIAIIGGGATGVELAAELHYAILQAIRYAKSSVDPKHDIQLVIIEAAHRILVQLPERLSDATLTELQRRGIQVLSNERVASVTAEAIFTHSGITVPARLKVWAAGIKAPDFLAKLDGLEANRINQLLVNSTLQTTLDENIFAFGDCASCPIPNSERTVPPRAQAAHQQASLLVKSITNRLQNKPLPIFHYRDHGSLISLSQTTAVGNLMGGISGRNLILEGALARWAYWSLYKMHQMALFGMWRVALLTIAHSLSRAVKPRLKLH